MQAPGLSQDIFPTPDTENRAICVPGVGSTKPFSALVVDVMMDREVISKGQCFPRYRYERRDEDQGELLGDAGALTRVDNITDTALRAFRVHYADNTITRDAIFDYVYGILHAPAWRERFANDLTKDLPRIPFAPDFHAFAEAGGALAALHLGYETGPQYPLEAVAAHGGEISAEDCRIGERAMRFADDAKTTLIVNDRLRLARDRDSGIVNDANAWFDDPRDLIAAIRQVVHLSLETVRIVDGLPE